MKKTALFSAALFCASLFSQAQITKGSLFLGGSLGFGKTKSETNTSPTGAGMQEAKNNGWNIRPQIGTAVAENRIVGVFLSFTKNHNEQKNGTITQSSESWNNGGGIFYRRYYPLSQRFFLFGEAAAGIGFAKQETTNSGTVSFKSFEAKSTDVNLALTPGLSYAASKKIFLEASLNSLLNFGVSSGERKSYDFRGTLLQTTKDNSVGANINANGFSNLSVGLRWILPRK